jgi:hypothetical protein
MPQYVILLTFSLLHRMHLLIEAYRPEFAENYQQEPADGPIVMPVPLPSFIEHHASMSSLKNGNTGNLIETELVFSLYTFHDFLFA